MNSGKWNDTLGNDLICLTLDYYFTPPRSHFDLNLSCDVYCVTVLVDLRFGFCKRPYVVTMEMFTAVILLPFNMSDQLTFRDLADITQLQQKVILRQLHLLVNTKILITRVGEFSCDFPNTFIDLCGFVCFPALFNGFTDVIYVRVLVFFHFILFYFVDDSNSLSLSLNLSFASAGLYTLESVLYQWFSMNRLDLQAEM